jgi:gas vesicle protein
MRNESYSNYGKASNGGSHAFAILSALAFGVAVGMLFAPSEGRRLRGQLKDGAQRLGRRAADGYNSAAETATHLLDRGRSAVDTGREAFQQARSDVHSPADM